MWIVCVCVCVCVWHWLADGVSYDDSVIRTQKPVSRTKSAVDTGYCTLRETRSLTRLLCLSVSLLTLSLLIWLFSN